MFYKDNYLSPLGEILIASDGENLVGLWFKGQKYFLGTINEPIYQKDDLEIFKKTKTWLDKYFEGKKPQIADLSIAPMGSDFRKRVWKILCAIPYGKTVTYGQIARQMAADEGKDKMSAQAVGGAVGHNPISIIIPCHRVIGSNNSLTGYAGGISTKIRLLELEGIDTKKVFAADISYEAAHRV